MRDQKDITLSKYTDAKTGDAVVSVCGRDCARVYATVGVSENRVLVSDGSSRKLENPKKKSISHLRLIAGECVNCQSNETIAYDLEKYGGIDRTLLRQRYYKPEKG